MTYFHDLSKTSVELVKNLIRHSRDLVIKDCVIADSLETSSSVQKANEFFEVYYKRDSYPYHDEIVGIINSFQVFSKSEILSKTENKSEIGSILLGLQEPISSTDITSLVEKIRSKIINEYEDENPYYRNLQTKGVPIWISRFAEEFDLIQENNITDNTLLKFSDSYQKMRKFFLVTMYNKNLSVDAATGTGLSKINTYHCFCRMVICLMTIIDILHSHMKDPFDFDYLTESDIDQFLFSFGFYEFKDFPFKYKRRLVDSLNRLIEKKGTDSVFVDIMSIFDYKGFSLLRYHLLVDKVSLDENGFPVIEKDPRFVGYDLTKYNEASDAIKESDYKEFSFEEVTQYDSTWQASKEEISSLSESHLASKYFSLTTSMDLTKNAADTALLINFIKKLKEENPDKYDLYFFNTKISPTKISLANAIVALQSLVLDFYDLEDVIIFSESGLLKVFSFNTSDSNLNYSNVYEDNVNSMVLFDLESQTELSDSKLSSLFNYNEKMKETVEDYMSKKQRTHLFTPAKMKSMKESYASKFTADFNLSNYAGYTHYHLWLRDEDPSLYEYVIKCFSESKENKREMIIDLMDSISDYCAATSIRFDTIFNSEVALYVKKLVDVFKSYTVTLKDFKIYYLMDEKLFFSLIEELKVLSRFIEKEDKTGIFSLGSLMVAGTSIDHRSREINLLEKVRSDSFFKDIILANFFEKMYSTGEFSSLDSYKLGDILRSVINFAKETDLKPTDYIKEEEGSFKSLIKNFLSDEPKSRSDFFNINKFEGIADYYKVFLFSLLSSELHHSEIISSTSKLGSGILSDMDMNEKILSNLRFHLSDEFISVSDAFLNKSGSSTFDKANFSEILSINLLSGYTRFIKENSTLIEKRIISSRSLVNTFLACSDRLEIDTFFNKSDKFFLSDSFVITTING